jgi:hypothetical protein
MVGAASIAGAIYVSRQIGWPEGIRVLYSGMAVICVFLWSWIGQAERHGRRHQIVHIPRLVLGSYRPADIPGEQ